MSSREGEAEFVTADGTRCKTWYTIFGDLTTTTNNTTHRPLVVIHGGPGLVHDYLLSIADLARTHLIPIILYDQLGNGRSTHLPHKRLDASFWTPSLFISELENLVRALGIEGAFDVYGHSWGGMLGAMYAARCQPKGLHNLIIASAPSSMPVWDEVQAELRSRLPRDIQDVLSHHEQAGTTTTTSSPEFKSALFAFYAKHACKLDPMPHDLISTFEWLEKDNTVTMTMYGPDEFRTLGSLKDWEIGREELGRIGVPMLLINGRDDTAQDRVVAPYFEHVPKVKWVQFAESSHMAHMEERERFLRVVGAFLTRKPELSS